METFQDALYYLNNIITCVSVLRQNQYFVLNIMIIIHNAKVQIAHSTESLTGQRSLRAQLCTCCTYEHFGTDVKLKLLQRFVQVQRVILINTFLTVCVSESVFVQRSENV